MMAAGLVDDGNEVDWVSRPILLFPKSPPHSLSETPYNANGSRAARVNPGITNPPRARPAPQGWPSATELFYFFQRKRSRYGERP